jgi:hypothetical protein
MANVNNVGGVSAQYGYQYLMARQYLASQYRKASNRNMAIEMTSSVMYNMAGNVALSLKHSM